MNAGEGRRALSGYRRVGMRGSIMRQPCCLMGLEMSANRWHLCKAVCLRKSNEHSVRWGGVGLWHTLSIWLTSVCVCFEL